MRKILYYVGLLLLFSCLVLNMGCSSKHDKDFQTPLKLGILADVYALPAIIAQKNGYFKQLGLNIILVPFQNRATRNQAFIRGSIDLMEANLVTASIMKDEGINIKVLATLKGGHPQQGRSAIIVNQDSPILNLKDLAGKKIAISPNPIYSFIIDNILEGAGLSPSSVTKVKIDNFSDALTMLSNNKVSAALFPETLLSFAQQQGFHIIADDLDKHLYYAVLVAHGALCDKYTSLLKKLTTAYSQAIEVINRKPIAFRKEILQFADFPSDEPDLLREELLCMAKAPRGIKKSIPIPSYAIPEIPSKESIQQVFSWLHKNRMLKNDISYDDFVINCW